MSGIVLSLVASSWIALGASSYLTNRLSETIANEPNKSKAVKVAIAALVLIATLATTASMSSVILALCMWGNIPFLVISLIAISALTINSGYNVISGLCKRSLPKTENLIDV